MTTYIYSTLGLLAVVATVFAAPPKDFSVLPEGKLVKGATVQVEIPDELESYLVKVDEAAQKDPEWFEQFVAAAKPGVPLPFHEKLGLTKEEYDEYMKIWEKREFKTIEQIVLELKQKKDGTWAITTAGGAFPVSTLRYDEKKDIILSPNGEMKRLDEVKAEKTSILGAWTGAEWSFHDKNTLGETKENFAIGKTADEKFGMIIYRLQEISTEGTPLYDDSIVLRFPLGEAGLLKIGEAP